MNARAFVTSVGLLVGACHVDASGLAVAVDTVDGQVIGANPLDAGQPSGPQDAGSVSGADSGVAPTPVCRGLACECEGREQCEIDCPFEGCDVSCHDARRCDTSCGRACSGSCDRTEGCDATCGDACSYTCANTDRCALNCGDTCRLLCRNLGNCEAQVGADSTVTCQDLAVCRITCTGACRVACDRVSSCEVACSGPNLIPLDGEGEHGCRAANIVR